MTLSIVPMQSDRRWPTHELDLRPIKDPRSRRLAVLMVGAGFSKAANAKSPTWTELVKDVAVRMKISVSGQDPRADAMTLSWRGSRRPSSALETAFQVAVTDSLKESGGAAGVDLELLTAVAELLTNTRCDVIIDLNYDHTAETMLDANGIAYYRVVGAQMDVRPPLPEGMVVLWKIHGSIDYPPTIVLSPTEYQRKYEVNDLGNELVRLGQEAHIVWSVGVGLQDDDVWTFLTLNAHDLEIVALHLSNVLSTDLPNLLQPWEQVLGDGVAKATVLAATLSALPTGMLRHCVEQLNAMLPRQRGLKPKDHAVTDDVKLFDDRFNTAREHGFEPAVRAIVEEFADRHEKLVHFLLTRSHDKGHRWLPFFTRGDIRIDAALGARVAPELFAILTGTRDFLERFADDWPNGGLLVGAAAQSVVRYVFEWLEAFDIEHTVRLAPLESNPVIRRERPILVGANPFDADVRSARNDLFNAMQLFITKKSMPLYYPLVDESMRAPRGAPLLEESQWEAAIISMFHARKPCLELGTGETFDLDWAWPVFPWGFGRKSIAAYRASSGGTVTQSWHLVSNRLSGGRQICKGGSLRDRGETVFMVARRGSIRIGEYDDFVQSSV